MISPTWAISLGFHRLCSTRLSVRSPERIFTENMSMLSHFCGFDLQS